MFFNFPDFELERLIGEDVPYFDLTTRLLGVDGQRGVMEFYAKEEMVVACSEEAARILERLGSKTEIFVESGKPAEGGDLILKAYGNLEALHAGWKVSQVLLEYASAIATRTAKLLERARAINPGVVIATTRKNFPGGKRISVKAVLSGGGIPHRLGLSETVLFFKQHYDLLGGLDRFLTRLEEIKQKAPEKKIAVEVSTLDDALKLLKHRVDIVQLDKVSPEVLNEVVEYRNGCCPEIKIAAAGGINSDNIESYAIADIIVTSCVYFGKPKDVKVEIKKL